MTRIGTAGLDFDLDVQISRWSSTESVISFATMSDIDAIFDTCWYIDGELLFLKFESSRDFFTVFGIGLTDSLTGRTDVLCLHHSEDSL